MNSSKILNPNRKLLLNGIFGLFKEKGDSIEDNWTWIRLTHYQETRLERDVDYCKSPFIDADINPRHSEPFTTGVLCVGIGTWSTRLTPLSQFWPHEWLVSAKLGSETEHYCLDSPVVKEMPFNHINEELLTETLKQFIGAKPQFKPPVLWKESLLIKKQKPKKIPEYVAPTKPTSRIRECHSIDVLSFKPPDIQLKVISSGSFSCRSLIHDLGQRLNSCAHLTDLCLNRMGDITPEQCLKKYEIHLNEMSEAIQKYSKLYSKELEKFENLMKTKRRFV